MQKNNTPKRCSWCLGHELYIDYHDREWGLAVHDDRQLFEMLILEGAQAGLNWLTILKKREGYRQAFEYFDVQKIARFNQKKIERLLQDPGIVRNRLKVNAAVTNARAFLEIQAAYGSFNQFVWEFVEGQPIVNRFKNMSEVPATSQQSDVMSKALKKRGFKFVGSTICYAFMQAVGMVNDHTTDCFRWKDCQLSN